MPSKVSTRCFMVLRWFITGQKMLFISVDMLTGCSFFLPLFLCSLPVEDDADGILLLTLCRRRIGDPQNPLRRPLPVRRPHRGGGCRSLRREGERRSQRARPQSHREGTNAPSQRRVREPGAGEPQEDGLVSLTARSALSPRSHV